eukprot:Nitzschia sp. Nitz4//scaffold126_size65214//15487//16506//NITZ4_006148-RA/size65214-processed-gene-0.20-mRNA-1//1//CDS//3329534665//7139//frame0
MRRPLASEVKAVSTLSTLHRLSASTAGQENSSGKLQESLTADTIVKISYDNEDPEKPQFIVGYWSMHGLGAPIRMMLSAAQVPHWVVMYDVTEKDPDVFLEDHTDRASWIKESWMNEKARMKAEVNPLINLPYLIDHDKLLVQSIAILSYLGRKLDMLGKTPEEEGRCQTLLCETMDLRNVLMGFAYGGKVDTARRDAEQMLNAKAGPLLDKLEEYLKFQSDGRLPATFLVGDSMSAPDFFLWIILHQFEKMCEYYGLKEALDPSMRPYLRAYYERFGALPVHQPHFASELTFAGIPFNNPYARFGSETGTNGPYVSQTTKSSWRKNGIVHELRSSKLK